ncbi:MAG TPA: ABC transporter permease [Thermoanaerobaculia bacterium]
MTESVEERPLIEIAPSSGWRALDLAELFQFRELLGVLVWRDVKVRYRQTLLGVIWVVAQPLLTMLIFTVLFNRVAKIQAGGNVPYALFVMAALVPWTFFSTAVSAASNSLIGSAHLISKVYFPRMIVPASSVAGGLVDMAVTLAIVLVMCAWYGTPLSPMLLLLPLVAVVTTFFAFGCGLWLSALNVEYRDIRVVVPFLLQIWMYLTPVAYPASVLPAKFRFLVDLNPMTGLIEAFRGSILSTPVPWGAVAYSVACTAVIVVTGAFYFRRVERQFADVL